MGWKGTLRSMSAASKRASRESERRQREAQRRRLAVAKQEMRQKAEELVEEHNSYLNFLTSFHKEISEPIDWNEIENSEEPTKPELLNDNEIKARNKYENFKPNFFHNILNNAESSKEKLKNKIETAKFEDQRTYEGNLKQYEIDLKNWKEDKDKAQQVKANNFEIINKILLEMNPFSDLIEMKIDTKLISCDSEKWVISSIMNDTEIIRGYERTVLRNGELSSKPMTKSKVTALMEDIFASINIRVAREMFTLFPVENLIVNTNTLSRNTNNGRLEPQLVLSCLYTREKVGNIDFNYIDPSDYIKTHVKYNSGFKKTNVVLVDEVKV